MERPIRGPDRDADLFESKEAAKFIGDVGADLFEALMAQHLPTVRPIWVGRYKMWQWFDIAVLLYILGRAETTAPKQRAKGVSEAES